MLLTEWLTKIGWRKWERRAGPDSAGAFFVRPSTHNSMETSFFVKFVYFVLWSCNERDRNHPKRRCRIGWSCGGCERARRALSQTHDDSRCPTGGWGQLACMLIPPRDGGTHPTTKQIKDSP